MDKYVHIPQTQIISDMNEMIINVSRSEFCSDASDGNKDLKILENNAN